MKISGGDLGLSGRNLGELVCGLVVASGDVVELEAVEFFFHVPDLLAVGLHLGVVAA
jgi:hypothetical protein